MSTIEKIKQVRDTLRIGLTEAKLLVEEFGAPEKAIEGWHKQQQQVRLAEEARKFVDPEHWVNDWYWKSCPVAAPDLETLKYLSKNYCKHLWGEYITEHADHLLRPDVEKDWKIRNNKRITIPGNGDYNWESDSDENDLNGLGAFLNPYLDWNPEDRVWLFFGRYSGFQLNWELFLKYAHPLLLHSYGVVLVNINNPKVVIFEEHGYIQIGERVLTGAPGMEYKINV